MSREAHREADGEPPSIVAPYGSIPGPGALELIRILPDLSSQPLKVFSRLAATYGDVFALRYPLDNVVMVADPDGIEHVLHHAHHRYAKATSRWRTLRQIWGEGLLTADGDAWRRQRQRIQPAFHKDHVESFAQTVATEAERTGDAWTVAARSGEPLDVYTEMLRCTLRALLKAMFGSDADDRADMLVHAVEEINGYIDPTAPSNLWNLPIPVRRWVQPGFRPFQRAMDTIRRTFGELIDARVRSGEIRPDLLGLIMAGRDDERSETMSVRQVHDEMMTLLMAGHETSGITSTWTWYWLAGNPGPEARLHAELDAVLGGRAPAPADLPALEYTRRVIDEVLRLSPTIYAFDRMAMEDDVVCGYRIPKGTAVAISPYLMHRHARYWDRPLEFDPDRFIAPGAASRPAYAYLPFGGGPRRCVGMRMALTTTPLLIATLARRYRLRVKPGHPVEELARVNLSPKYGMLMRIEPRQPSGGVPAASDISRSPASTVMPPT